MKPNSVKPIRCAIYTRVSTDQGLDQEFNSLDAQYDASAAYIKSQAHAGWTLIKARYDDGRYSGGSTDRPALRRLLDDIRARKIDVIVVGTRGGIPFERGTLFYLLPISARSDIGARSCPASRHRSWTAPCLMRSNRSLQINGPPGPGSGTQATTY
jgi:hypothetical protein